MTLHYKFSPSSATRLLTCQPSLEFGAKVLEAYGEPEPSEYAIEGTRAHAACEAMLNGEEFDWEGDLSMQRHVAGYVKYVAEVATEAVVLWVEKTMESFIHPDFGGTADAVVLHYDDDRLVAHIVDLKYGEGVRVDAEENAQMYCYMLLLRETFPSVEEFRATIYQPRTFGPAATKTKGVTNEELDHFEEQIEEVINNPKQEYSAGPHCNWCPAKPLCPLLQELAMSVLNTNYDEIIASPDADERIAEILRSKGAIISFLSSLEDFALRRMKEGQTYQGLKVVKRKGNRTWAITGDELIKKLQQRGLGKKLVTETKVLSPTKIEKMVSDYSLIEDLIYRPDHPMKVVAENARGEAIEFGSAEDAFDALDVLEG